jgi:FMN reductase
MTTITLISGSPSKQSKTAEIANRLQKELLKRGHHVHVIHVRDLPAEDLLHAKFDSEAIAQTHEWIRESDAVMVLSPVYKGSYTGILKAFLDLLPEKAFLGKIIAPIVTGGTIAHLLSIEYALKPIFSIMGAKEILHGVFILDKTIQRNETGEIFFPPDIEERIKEVLQSIAKTQASIS